MNPPSDETLFAAALALPAAERAAYLDQACAGDAALRVRLDALLSAAESAQHFMETSPLARAAAAVRGGRGESPAEEKPGDVIGRYKLLQKIGEGGCGVVYMAEQQEPVVRRVALKVIKLGMDTKEVIARFEAERQALALMDHPNIAKVLDGGATATGRPYFVMELVRGIALTKYCDENNVPTAERLQLFTAVCHAIQHAHQKGIIHRDIKPSNILVTLHDGVPVPKVIDFGIAKATQGRLTDATVFTAFEQFIGTPAYMSPEQAELSGLDIDTRSDIYSLGVLLYELLTGRTPFDAAELLKLGLDTMRRHIREVDPPKPSTRLSTLRGDALTHTAKQRQIAAPKLVSLIRGDLDWIVMKALEKNRIRRYDTANGLADDIARHLAHEPVTACPPSATYRLGKMVRRHKLGFAAGTAIAVSVVLGLLVSISQTIRARQAELAAQREAAISEAVSDFVKHDILRQSDFRVQADAKTPPNPNLTVQEALDRAVEKIGQRYARQPRREAAVFEAIGNTYLTLGLPDKATPHLDRARQLWQIGQSAENFEAWTAMDQRALELHNTGKLDEAAALYNQNLANRQRAFGPEHPAAVASMIRLASVYSAQGRLAEAATLFARAYEIRIRRLGPENAATQESMSNLADSHHDCGRIAEAVALFAQLEEIQRRVRGPEHTTTLATARRWAIAKEKLGDLTEAEARLRMLYSIAQKRDGEASSHDLYGTVLGRVLLKQQKFTEAEPMLRASLAVRMKKQPTAWTTYIARYLLGGVLVGQGKYAEAEPLLITGYDGLLKRMKEIPPRDKGRLKETVELLVKLYSGWGKPDKAAVWQKRLDELTAANAVKPSTSTPANAK